MDKGHRFASVSALAAERDRLDALRRFHGTRLERHWAALKDKDVRGTLFRDAISDMVASWRPARMAADLVGNGSITSAVGNAIFRRGGLAKRLLSFGATLALPYLLNKLGDMSLAQLKDRTTQVLSAIREFVAPDHDNDAPEEDDRP